MSESVTGAPTFIETKEYRRFAEFCDACRRDRYIGLCYGAPGVGKTLSAWHYARWELLGLLLEEQTFLREPVVQPERVSGCRSLVSTPSMTTTPRRLEEDLRSLGYALHELLLTLRRPEEEGNLTHLPRFADLETSLVLVDEADRLTFPTLEQLRDLYDRGHFGLVLIGMPGIERRLARYAQFYSRVGFVHQFRPLSADELRFLLERQWQDLGVNVDLSRFDDVEAMTAVIRITGGNFRLLQRLFAQVGRILAINQLGQITKEVVEAAREGLVIGTS
jgi:DNA transposition AAA+ family ATPase